MLFIRNKSVVVWMMLSFLSSGLSFAEVRSAKDFIKLYNKSRGTFLRNHDRAQEKLKEEYQRSVIEDYQGDIRAFFLATLGDLENYRRQRNLVKRSGDCFVTSSSASSLTVLYDFYIEKAQKALAAVAKNQEQTEDPIVNHLIKDLTENELTSIKSLRDSLGSAEVGGQTNVGKIVSGVSIGLALYWFGPAYAVEATRALFPYIWNLTVGPVPSAMSISYWTAYIPALNHTAGMVYTHSTPILIGCWAVCVPVLHGTASGIYHLVYGVGSLIKSSIQAVFDFYHSEEETDSLIGFETPVEEDYVLLKESS